MRLYSQGEAAPGPSPLPLRPAKPAEKKRRGGTGDSVKEEEVKGEQEDLFLQHAYLCGGVKRPRFVSLPGLLELELWDGNHINNNRACLVSRKT
jgi:hypothetical protein